MRTQTIVRITGIILMCLGLGIFYLQWQGMGEVLRSSGQGIAAHLGFWFLGRPVHFVNGRLDETFFHDTYVVTNPVWSWLVVLSCLAGTIMTVRPDWMLRNRPGGK